MEPFSDLEELHVGDQGLQSLNGVSHLKKLTIIDGANNDITELDAVLRLDLLEDLWVRFAF